MERLCIRGAGKLCRQLISRLNGEIQPRNYKVTYVAEKDETRFNQTLEEVEIKSVDECVQLYKKGHISKMVIFYQYGFKIISEMAEELLDLNIHKKDILIYQNEKFYDLEVFTRAFTFQMHTFNNAIYNKDDLIKENGTCKVYGSNWLSKYIRDYLERYNIVEGDYCLICEEGKELQDGLINKSNNSKIYLYNILYYYYYQNALWFNTLKTELKKKDAYGIATGISAIREAIKDHRIMNLSNSGQDLYYDYQMLKKYYNYNNIIPKFVIMGLSPLSLCYDMSLSQESKKNTLLYYPEVGTMHNHQNADFYKSYFDNHYSKISRILPKIDVEECFDNYYFGRMKKILDLGKIEFNEKNLSTDNKQKIRDDMKNLFYYSSTNNTENENKETIKKYLRFCKEKGIPVIIFYPPYSDFFLKEIDSDSYSRVKQFIKSLDKEFEFEILDLSELEMADNMFYDYAHLNNNGTEFIRHYIDQMIEKLAKPYTTIRV